MSRRISMSAMLGLLLMITAACSNKKSVNPLANIGSKQPDKVLFDKAMDAMKHNRFDVARMTLQTLINTYPDSEFIARAKLADGRFVVRRGRDGVAGAGRAGVSRLRDVLPQHAGSGRGAVEDRQHPVPADGEIGPRLYPRQACGG